MNEAQLDRYLEAVVYDLLAAIRMADITKPGSEDKLMAQLDSILDQYGRTLSDVVPEQIVVEYFGGVDDANRVLAAAGAGIATTKAIQAGRIGLEYRGLIHLEAVEAVINDAMEDIGDAIATTRGAARAAVLDTVEEVRQELATGIIKGNSQDVTTKRLMDRFLDGGLTAFVVEDKNGMLRRLPLHYYTRTVVRSKTRDAHVKGSVNRYRQTGQSYVRIVGNGDSCAQCSQYRNLVLAIGDADPRITPYTTADIPLPPYHPNCRCGVISFMPEEAAPEEAEAVAEAFDQYAPGKDRRTPAEKAAYEKEQRLRRIANAEAQQFQRWQTALGAEAPKTLSAFRRMKRQNTVKFQQLQSEYRSLAQQARKP